MTPHARGTGRQSATFGGVRAVDGASFAVEARSITGADRPERRRQVDAVHIDRRAPCTADSGRVVLDERRIDRLPPHRVARSGSSAPSRPRGRSDAHDGAREPRARAPRHPGERLGGVPLRPPREPRSRAARPRPRAGAARARPSRRAHADEYAGTLSGGQRKLLDFARVLMIEPPLLLLDEPMAGVSPALREQLLGHILDLRRDRRSRSSRRARHRLIMQAADRVVCSRTRPRDLPRARRTRSERMSRSSTRTSGLHRLTAPLLEANGLEAGYDDALILRGVDLTADAEQIVAIVGPNGAGKSTLLKAVYGLVRPSSGSVRSPRRGRDRPASRPATRRGMNFVPQIENVFPCLTIAENLHVGVLGLPHAERRSRRSHECWSCSRSSPSAAANARARSRAASASSSRLRAHSSRGPRAAPPRRALRGPFADRNGPRLRAARSRSAARDRDPDGRTERTPCAGDLRHRRRPRHRAQRLRGAQADAARTTRGRRALPRRAPFEQDRLELDLDERSRRDQPARSNTSCSPDSTPANASRCARTTAAPVGSRPRA